MKTRGEEVGEVQVRNDYLGQMIGTVSPGLHQGVSFHQSVSSCIPLSFSLSDK